MKYFLLLVFALCIGSTGLAQGSAFGLKGGLTIGTQKWNSIDRDPLFAWHGAAYIESLPEANDFSLMAQLGYHVKGSAIRNSLIFINGIQSRSPVQTFEFYNLSLVLAAKQKYDLGLNGKYYYILGLRGDYTLDHNLEEYEEINQFSGFYPFPNRVRKLNFGLTVGGGMEFMFAELVGGLLEFTVNPDLTAQYRQEAIQGTVNNPYTGNPISIGERVIRNLTFEISLGIRLLRKVEYID